MIATNFLICKSRIFNGGKKIKEAIIVSCQGSSKKIEKIIPGKTFMENKIMSISSCDNSSSDKNIIVRFSPGGRIKIKCTPNE